MADQNVVVNIIAQTQDAQSKIASYGGQIKALSARIEELTNGTVKLTAAGRFYDTQQQKFISTQRASQIVSRGLSAEKKALELEERRLATAVRNTAAAMGIQETDAQGLALANRNLAQQNVQLANTTGSASFAVISLGQGFQDAGQFGMGMAQGIRAVTNNAQQAFQALVLLRNQTGSAGSAFAAFRTAMMGPAGLLLAFGAVTAAVEFFANRSQRAAKEVTALKNAVGSLVDVADDIDKINVNLDILKAAREEEERRLEAMRAALKSRIGENNELRARGQLSAEAVQNLLRQGVSQRQVNMLVSASLEDFREQIRLRETVLTGLVEQELAAETRLSISQAARKNTALETARINDLNREGLGEEVDLDLSLLKRGRERFNLQEELNQIRTIETETLRAAVLASGDLLDNSEEILAAVGAEIELRRALLSIRQNEADLARQRATDSNDPLLILDLENIDLGRRLETEADRAERAIERLNLALSRQLGAGVADMLVNFATAEGGLKNFGSQLMAAVGGLAVSLGKSMIQFGIAGIAIKKFIANPFAAIAAGTALVVLGSQLARSAQSRMDSFSTGASQSTSTFRPAPGTAGIGFGAATGSIGVAPASILQQQSPVGGNGFSGRFVIEGRDLVAALTNEADFQSRAGVRNPVFSR